jgi:outer membrane protein assembly factor BamB
MVYGGKQLNKHMVIFLILFFLVSTSFIGVSNQVSDNSSTVQEESYQYMMDWSVDRTNQTIGEESWGPFYNTVKSSEMESNPLGGPMDSAWPMFGHDVVHTCKSPFSTENNSGVEIWYVRGVETGAVWGSAIIDNDEIVYFGTQGADGALYALYPNGTRKWRYATDGIIWGTPALTDNGTIYFTTWGAYHYFYALNPNGIEKWLFAPDGGSTSSPSIAEDGTIYFGDDNHIIYAINTDGTEKWRYTTGYIVMGSPAIGQDGTIYIGSGDHYLYALYPNGTLHWRFATGGEIKGSASIAQDGTIYVPSFDGYLYALYPNGTMKWRSSTGSSLAAAGVALADDDTIYIGTEKLRAYNPDGTLKWMTDVQGSIYGSIPAISADGTIYVSAGGSLVAVNPDGSEKWRNQLTPVQIRSSPSIGSDDHVYVGSEDAELSPYGYLHAFGILDPNTPTTPIITGTIKGKIEKTCNYTFTSTSPLANNLFYQIDWGNGTLTDWLGPYNSGEPVTLSHSWSEKGNYTIRARAKDTDNRWGPWGQLEVTMPYSYEPQFPFIHWLLERFPNAFPLLRYLMGFNQYL